MNRHFNVLVAVVVVGCALSGGTVSAMQGNVDPKVVAVAFAVAECPFVTQGGNEQQKLEYARRIAATLDKFPTVASKNVQAIEQALPVYDAYLDGYKQIRLAHARGQADRCLQLIAENICYYPEEVFGLQKLAASLDIPKAAVVKQNPAKQAVHPKPAKQAKAQTVEQKRTWFDTFFGSKTRTFVTLAAAGIGAYLAWQNRAAVTPWFSQESLAKGKDAVVAAGVSVKDKAVALYKGPAVPAVK